MFIHLRASLRSPASQLLIMIPGRNMITDWPSQCQWILELCKAFDCNLLLGTQSQTDTGPAELSLSPSSSGFSCRKVTELMVIKTSGYREENSPLLSDWLLWSPGVAWEGKS